MSIRIKTDSASARSFAHKPGLSKLKHVQIREMFIKDLVREGIITLERVQGTRNCANVLTKP
eukprot:9346466-Lingulodinium_polyedra.AAC.1